MPKNLFQGWWQVVLFNLSVFVLVQLTIYYKFIDLPNWITDKDPLLPLLVIGVGGDVKTLPLSVASLAGFYDKEWALILTSVLMAALPVLILFIFAQKHIIKGMTSGAIK